MAMGFSSTQTTSLRPSCPSYLWLSHSCLHTSHMAFSSSRYFSASTKTLHRREVCTIQSANRTSPSIIMFSSSLQLKQSSSYCTGPSIGKHRHNDAEYHSPYRWELEVPTGTRNSFTPIPKMVRKFPNQFCAEGKPSSGKFFNPQKMQKENEVPRHLHGPPAWEMGVNSPPRSSGSGTASQTTLSYPWLEESEKLRIGKKVFGNGKNSRVDLAIRSGETILKNAQAPEHLQDNSAYELKFWTGSCSSESDNAVRKGDSGSLSSEGSAGFDQINLQTRRSPCKPSGEEQRFSVSGGGSVFTKNTKNHVSHAPASHEQGYNGNNYIAMNRVYRPILDHSRPTGLSLEHIPSKGVQSNRSDLEERKETNSQFGGDRTSDAIGDITNGKSATMTNDAIETRIELKSDKECQLDLRKRLGSIYGKVLVVDNIRAAKEVVRMLTDRYRHLVHACDTEVAKIDVKQETPVDHGEIICFSIYSGPDTDFGNGKNCIWVDVLDGGGTALLVEFAPFFEDPSIKKVWHNYSFDNHVLENYGLNVSGFHADTMHMARLWDSSRRTEGGYSLEALTCDQRVMSKIPLHHEENLIGKVSMKTIFGRRKVRKDGSEGKIIAIPPVEELQREEREPWICYSALDSMSTLKLYEILKRKLREMNWNLDGSCKGSMFDFYETYWQPFGELLVKMETEGMLVDRAYLAEMEKVAIAEQQVAANRFRNWACKYCPDAKYMNVGSDAQLRQLFFGGTANRKDPLESLPIERTFKVPNVDKVIEEGKKTPTKFCNITLRRLGDEIPTDLYTASGWPSVSGDALKTLAGKVSAEFDSTVDALELQPDDDVGNGPETVTGEVPKTQEQTASEDVDTSAYGTAYAAFGWEKGGREACHAIAALCEVCSIDSLISNFILPLQGSHVSGKNGRIHCSLNINTETGRLSARKPNLQNQPALEKDRYKIRQAFIAAPGNSLIVADYGQLELRILAHLASCKSMLDAFKAGGDFHSRTAMNMYPHIRGAVEEKRVLLEWHPQPGEDKPPVPLLKDAFGSERRKAKMLNFSIAYGKTPVGLARDWKVSVKEAKATVDLWYRERKEVLTWQEERKQEAHRDNRVHTLLGRARRFPSLAHATYSQRGHIERAAINTPVQGSAADVAMCAMLEISRNKCLKELGWRLLLQVHDEVILEGPTESAEIAKAIVIECMSKPFNGKNILNVDLSVDAKCAKDWYSAK